MKTYHVDFFVNGEEYELDVPANKTALNIIRDMLDLTGAKEGCGAGECGTYRGRKGRKTHFAVRIPPWALSSARWYPLYVSHSRKQDKIKADTLNGSR